MKCRLKRSRLSWIINFPPLPKKVKILLVNFSQVPLFTFCGAYISLFLANDPNRKPTIHPQQCLLLPSFLFSENVIHKKRITRFSRLGFDIFFFSFFTTMWGEVAARKETTTSTARAMAYTHRQHRAIIHAGGLLSLSRSCCCCCECKSHNFETLFFFFKYFYNIIFLSILCCGEYVWNVI